MKKLALTFVMTLFLAACSSGTSVSEEPNNLTGNYSGSFQNQENTDSGTAQINIVENSAGAFTGFAQFLDSKCLVNGPIVSGNTVGFAVTLNISQDAGALSLQLTTDNASRLTGTYFLTGNAACSNASATGTINLTRG